MVVSFVKNMFDLASVTTTALDESVLIGIGLIPAKLFMAKGWGHGFDGPLFLGDSGRVVVEEAWAALDGIVTSKV